MTVAEETIKDLQKRIEELTKDKEKLQKRVNELERTDEQLAKKLKSKVSWDNEAMHWNADDLLLDFLRAIWYEKSANQYQDMMKDFRYA